MTREMGAHLCTSTTDRLRAAAVGVGPFSGLGKESRAHVRLEEAGWVSVCVQLRFDEEQKQ